MVLACSDLGVSPERVFDLRPGELIVPQNAALTVDDAVAASVALAYELHGVNLLVVLGHARCCVLDSPDKHPRGLMRDEVRATLRCATQGETGKVHATRVASQLRQRFAQLPELHVAAAYMDESSGRVEFL